MSGKWVTKATGSTPPIDDFGTMNEQNGVLLFQGKNTFGDDIYCFLELPLNSIDDVKAHLAAGKNFTPSQFGKVLAAGRGTPSQEVKDEIGKTHFMLYFEPKRLPNMPGQQG